MSLKVKCRRCGAENELNRMFCIRCGAKLDMERSALEFEKAGRPTFLGSVGRFLRTVIGLALLAAIGLLLWPVAPAGEQGSTAEAKFADAKLRALYQAVKEKRMDAQVFSEKELNAYLAAILAQNKEAQQSSGMRVGIRAVNVSLVPPHAVLLVVATLGPMPLSYEVSVTPAEASGFAITIDGARFGHLPLPPAAGSWLTGRMSALFSGMKRELAVLENLDGVTMGEHKVRLVTRMPAAL